MKKNLTFYFSAYAFLIFSSPLLNAQNFNYLGTFTASGRPNYLAPSDIIPSALSRRVSLSLPQNYPVPQYHPEYLSPNHTTDIQLQDTTDVWITFMDEGAGYKNTLGFYTYNLSTPPTKVPKIEDITVIFPNISSDDGTLTKGDKVHLGRFAKNTGIGFVLIANAFQNGSIITRNKSTFYSNSNFNPESDPTKRQHSVLLRDSSGLLVIGFEDLLRNTSGADNDFNDAVFYITANPSTAFIGNMPLTIGTPTTISSGNIGGLESDGCLASVIAARNFNRVKTPSVSAVGKTISFENPDDLKPFIAPQKGTLEMRGDIELEQFIPQQPFFEPTSARISSPKDLIGITNAQKVLSVDYFDDVTQERVAAVLTTKTENKVYDHTKVICDRLIGSTLLYTETITIDDKPFIRSVLQRENGAFEYNISFAVAKENDNTVTVLSRWSIDEYPSKSEFWNFQMWAEAPHLSQKVVEEVLLKFKEQYLNVKGSDAAQVPQVYVKKGFYDNGVLTLTVNNPLNARFLTLKGNYTNAETSTRENFSKQVILDGSAEETVEVFVGSIFDMGFTVRNEKSTDFDALYFADGVWGVEYDKTKNKLEKYTVNTGLPLGETGIFTLERNPILRGQLKDYISVYRSLRPANIEADITGFKNISFTGMGTGIVEVTLVKKSITDFAKQYRTEVPLFNEEQNYTLALKDFTNGTNEPIKADDLVNVVFTIKGDGQTAKPFELALSNVAFDNKTIKNFGEKGVLTAFPNPSSENTELTFDITERSTALVTLTNMQGMNVIERKEEMAKGRNRMMLNLNNLPSGVYIAAVTTATGRTTTKVMIP
jgi:Domain of unknown function (DUF4114)/Secretion system C-terminal sorting domain